MSSFFDTTFLSWSYRLDEIFGWVFVLAVVALYSVMFALTRPRKLRWWATAITALAITAALIWISP